MAGTIPVALNWDQGFASDLSRDQLPKGTAYRMRDYIPQDQAPLRKRGGWGYATGDLNVLSGASYISGVGWAPFPGDPHLVEVSETGKVYQTKTFPNGLSTYAGNVSGQSATHSPFWHSDRMVFVAQMEAAAGGPYKLTKAASVYTLAAISAAPYARVGCSWGDYLLLANYYDPSDSNALKNYRIAWSDVGDPDSFTLSGSNAATFDMPMEIVKVELLRNISLVWGYDQLWVLTGDTPPPGGNLARRLLTSNGTFDGRSVKKYKEYAIWANNSGVYKTDGATLTDITYKSGVSLYYRSLLQQFNFHAGWSASGGILFGHYFLTILNPAGVEITTLVFDIERQTCFEFRNFPVTMYAERPSGPGTAAADGHEELFFSHRTLPRAGMMAQVWTPTTSVDADGSVVLPELETPFFKLGTPGLKRVRRAYLSYDLRDSTGSMPTLEVGMVTSPEATAYVTLSPVLHPTSDMERAAVEVRHKGAGVAFKISQTAASDETRLYEVELEGHELEPSR